MAVDTSSGTVTPLTGDEYLESIRDGREIWVYGERVEDVTTHPAFRNARGWSPVCTTRCTTRSTKDVLTDGDRHRRRGVHPSRSSAPRDRGRAASPTATRSPQWARMTLRLDGPQPRLQGRASSHARRQRRLLRPLPGERPALVSRGAGALPVLQPRDHQPADRPRQGRRRGRATSSSTSSARPTRASIVSGAKVVATGSALTHYNFIAHYGAAPIKTKEFAVIFVVPMDAPGVKLICRPSYEMTRPRSWGARSTTRCPAAWTRTTR